MPCLIHLDENGKSNHTNCNCKFVNDLKTDPEVGYKRTRKRRPRGKGGKCKEDTKEGDAMYKDEPTLEAMEFGTTGGKSSNPFEKKKSAASFMLGTYHTFLGTPSIKAKKSAWRALNATVPKVPQYAKWSEKAVTSTCQDHPDIVPREHYALVVNPLIDGYDFTKCLMDGGSSLNIMYIETLLKMDLTETQLKHINVEFYGVFPGRRANSLGSITLPVASGGVNFFHKELIDDPQV